MKNEKTLTGLEAVEERMNALRSALLEFSEEQSEGAVARSDPLHVPLMHSVMTIQAAMKTFLSIATCCNK